MGNGGYTVASLKNHVRVWWHIFCLVHVGRSRGIEAGWGSQVRKLTCLCGHQPLFFMTLWSPPSAFRRTKIQLPLWNRFLSLKPWRDRLPIASCCPLAFKFSLTLYSNFTRRSLSPRAPSKLCLISLCFVVASTSLHILISSTIAFLVNTSKKWVVCILQMSTTKPSKSPRHSPSLHRTCVTLTLVRALRCRRRELRLSSPFFVQRC